MINTMVNENKRMLNFLLNLKTEWEKIEYQKDCERKKEEDSDNDLNEFNPNYHLDKLRESALNEVTEACGVMQTAKENENVNHDNLENDDDNQLLVRKLEKAKLFKEQLNQNYRCDNLISVDTETYSPLSPKTTILLNAPIYENIINGSPSTVNYSSCSSLAITSSESSDSSSNSSSNSDSNSSSSSWESNAESNSRRNRANIGILRMNALITKEAKSPKKPLNVYNLEKIGAIYREFGRDLAYVDVLKSVKISGGTRLLTRIDYYDGSKSYEIIGYFEGFCTKKQEFEDTKYFIRLHNDYTGPNAKPIIPGSFVYLESTVMLPQYLIAFKKFKENSANLFRRAVYCFQSLSKPDYNLFR